MRKSAAAAGADSLPTPARINCHDPSNQRSCHRRHRDSAAVIAVIHATAEAWNSQDFSKVLELWDPAEPTPFYLAEEQDDWFIGWEPAEELSGAGPAEPGGPGHPRRDARHHGKTHRTGPGHRSLVDAFRDEDHRPQAHRRGDPGQRGSAPDDAGWRYIHWAESPMTAPMYLMKLMERDVDHDEVCRLPHARHAALAVRSEEVAVKRRWPFRSWLPGATPERIRRRAAGSRQP